MDDVLLINGVRYVKTPWSVLISCSQDVNERSEGVLDRSLGRSQDHCEVLANNLAESIDEWQRNDDDMRGLAKLISDELARNSVSVDGKPIQ